MKNLDHYKMIDISPNISKELGVFPGDKHFELEKVLSFDKGDNLTLGNISSTLHLGAHVDAPNHYHENGKSIDQLDLSIYLGLCQVIEVTTQKGKRVSINDLLKSKIIINCPRILIKTNSFLDPNNWNSDFSSLSPELIDYLSKKEVKLIGIDTPSVDPESDQSMLAHKAIYKNKMAILEGIVLKHVKEGSYQLMALPLNINSADASPVRAILLH